MLIIELNIFIYIYVNCFLKGTKNHKLANYSLLKIVANAIRTAKTSFDTSKGIIRKTGTHSGPRYFNIPLFSIFSPNKVPAKTVKTKVREFVMGTASDNSVRKMKIKFKMVGKNPKLKK